MVCKSLLGALGCFLLAVIGIERTLYWTLVLLAMISGSVKTALSHRSIDFPLAFFSICLSIEIAGSLFIRCTIAFERPFFLLA